MASDVCDMWLSIEGWRWERAMMRVRRKAEEEGMARGASMRSVRGATAADDDDDDDDCASSCCVHACNSCSANHTAKSAVMWGAVECARFKAQAAAAEAAAAAAAASR